jgi:hypothetical protein
MADLLLYLPSVWNDVLKQKRLERWEAPLSKAFVEKPRVLAEDSEALENLVLNWVAKGMARRDPKNVENWSLFLRGGLTSLGPGREIFTRFDKLIQSGDYKSYLPPHMIPMINQVEAQSGPLRFARIGKGFPDDPPDKGPFGGELLRHR